MYTSASGTISTISLDTSGKVLTVTYVMTKQPTASPKWDGRKFTIVTAGFNGGVSQTITGTVATGASTNTFSTATTSLTSALTGTYSAPTPADTFKISGKLW